MPQLNFTGDVDTTTRKRTKVSKSSCGFVREEVNIRSMTSVKPVTGSMFPSARHINTGMARRRNRAQYMCGGQAQQLGLLRAVLF